jgi:hypothetical protein
VSVLAAGWLCAAVAADPPAAKQVQQQKAASALFQGPGADPLDIRLSDEVTVTLRVEAPAPLRVELTDKVHGTDALLLESKARPVIRAVNGGPAVWEQELLLTPLQPGKHALTLPSLRYRSGEEKWNEVSWQPITVTVSTRIQKAEPSAARDITAIEELPAPQRGHSWLLWIGLGAGAVLLGGLAFLVGRRRAARRPPPSPEAVALRELDALAGQAPASAAEVERYHTALSAAVRRYLEQRFQIPAERQTTAEFLAAVQKSSTLTEPQQTLLGDLLTCCDLAKFARVRPAPEECHALVAQARAFVLETAEKAPPAPTP